jgi:hypothetical protein
VAADGYFTVREQVTAASEPPVSVDPRAVAEEIWEQVSPDFYEIRAAIYSLLNFDFHAQKYGDINEPYQRQKHFGAWVVDSRYRTCFNTRAQVLIRDSSVPVQLRSNGCTVEAGSWADPYSARDYTLARDIQIDHFVPLKNAYLSGAYKWNREKRCLYANFMGNTFHLLPVYGRENSSKGDRTPEGYMPPNPTYQCQYLAQWLKVKLIWNLGITSSEKAKILNLVQNNHCSGGEMSYTAADLEQQRRFIADNMDLCQ